ncbi:SAM-dependent methyltransferase [Dokdonella fugitiva]|uniref:SAM-dependent methyltransferase n=1 Tax=Dokdonella fugitiva TaxID=328517 RepID=A0A839F8A2_9GAMM|nr:class I SAM-dependent methyltransferase [Dokdonella fugitiva]MBA8888381.1 SAM-dependent methyltransferase [Dokdonella fugitiva]
MSQIPDSDATETICAGCAAKARAQVPAHVHRAGHNQRTYTLQQCPDCDLQFWWPLQADPTVYEGEGFEAYVDYHSGKRPFPRWAEPLFAALPPGRGRALDIGCGDGAVLHRLSQVGYEPHGIDLDEKSVAVARDKFRLSNVAVSTLDAYEDARRVDGERFDLVTFFEVLEHQDAPLEFLAQVRRLCRPGGVVAGSVPNRDRFLARFDRRLGDGDLPPHHFLWFSRVSLIRLLERAGFIDVEVRLTGALPYAQIVAKLGALVGRRLRKAPAGLRWLEWPIKAFVPALAVVPWIGMRLAPSHLFFRCTVPTVGAS